MLPVKRKNSNTTAQRCSMMRHNYKVKLCYDWKKVKGGVKKSMGHGAWLGILISLLHAPCSLL
jgi:hypothetical protein